jgi:hypothetical protein
MCDEVKGGTEHVSLIIEGELSPDAPAFIGSAYDISNRPKTTAQVVWDPAKWTAVEQLDQTSNIAPVIQEIISQPGWVSGNALVIVIRDNPANPSVGIRCAEAEPGVGSAMLHIEWSRNYAKDPNPDDGQTNVPRDLVLSWTSGEDTALVNGHKVYFSENFNDVKNGIGGITLSDTRYAPTQDIGLATTYYWRVDEVAPDNTVYEGRVWSFTTELFSYPIENVTVTASSIGQAEMGPENIINGSGLDDNDLHSTYEGDMWLSGIEPLGAWLQFEFDSVCKLLEMWVWNSNQTDEPLIGFGLKDVTVEYSTNGTDWTTLAGVTQFAQAPGTAGYQHTTVDFGGAAAKYVKVTATSNWGGLLPQYGLSEVRFVHIPVSARVPNPDSGATGVPLDVILDWAAGRDGVTHDVHFGDDRQVVIDSTTPVATVTESSYGPLDLDFGKTYYWRIDEINEAATPTTWPGAIWSFTTTDHLVVDDFESYNDLDPAHPKSNRIFNVWIDGFEVPTNGSIVGYEDPPFCEQSIVYGGMQSMPFFYSNTGGAAYSEAERTFAVPQNWTEASVQTFALHFHGSSGNTGRLYVKVNGSKVPYNGEASNLALSGWQAWNIDLASLGTGLQNVTKLAIGIDGNGGSGTLYFDDIGLYASGCEFITPVEPSSAGLIGHWKFDGDLQDSSGRGNHGATGASADFVAGKIGSNALNLRGTDYVVIDGVVDDITSTDITLSIWIKTTQSNEGELFAANDSIGDHPLMFGIQAGNPYVNDGGDIEFPPPVNDDLWHMLTYVRSGNMGYIYVDGLLRDTYPAGFSLGMVTRWSIGQEWDAGPSDFYTGAVDDARIYNYALSAAEVASVMGKTQPFDKPF